ncbi:alanine racemase [Ammoniphilus resinae]|uniref:D-serine deaminase-like pyridoxal phosphate-dependent protein n=1 Tax=Ammoniphilus resinae TaxID=861532 RepID=A0ABS4GM45_9BACL|nr:alanine racemase [Ammoniphilus resinae]MBP1931321.1 D-serine deaminase-like pyridoxal phosphate-dependent protein [Ammoniphilus resinae]
MIEHIDTPALVVDLEKMERNIENMANKAREAGVRLRPHVKTHKSPHIALKQMEMGASGITVAKLGEAEVMRKYGITNILIAYPIVGEQKLKRLEKLAQDTDVILSLDSFEVAAGISIVGERLGRALPIYIDVNTGLNRCGREPGNETVALIESILKLPYIKIQGLMTHGGHSYKAKSKVEQIEVSKQEGSLLVQTKRQALEKLGIDIPEISVGSSPTSFYCDEVEGITEIRPGTYVFHDATMVALGLVSPEDCALTIYATVVSRPSLERAIVDAGSKTLSSDKSLYTEGHGLVKTIPGLTVSWLSEEHGVILTPPELQLNIGDRVEIIPNHVCPTVNLADELVAIRQGEIEEIIPIEARGMNK